MYYYYYYYYCYCYYYYYYYYYHKPPHGNRNQMIYWSSLWVMV